MTPREPSQYFSEQPSGTEVRRTITARVWGRELPLITASAGCSPPMVWIVALPCCCVHHRYRWEVHGSWTSAAGMALSRWPWPCTVRARSWMRST